MPRYDGDPTMLQEYSFRVRLRQAREKTISTEELQKQGPLGLRLVDGLRGAALQVARNIPVDKLAGSEGPDLLIKQLNQSLKPRRAQECRELYSAGAQVHGILSRQSGESMSSFILRRKTWYRMLLDLDDSMRFPEAILSDQILITSGIQDDHKLLIRAAIGGDMTVDKICDELVAQHGRIHEAELRKSTWKTGQGKGKDRFPPRHRTWHANHADGEVDDWDDGHSQSLGGFEDGDDGSTVYASYASASEEHSYASYVAEDEDPIYEVYSAMCASGLDESDAEAVEHAAEVLQAESEVYYIHKRAQSSGHYGFGYNRPRQGPSNAMTSEQKQRIEALKKRTTCRRCFQVGHWSTDPVCPKGKGKGKKGSSSAPSSPTNKGGKSHHGKGDNKNKPRTVYFALNEFGLSDAAGSGESQKTSYMTIREFGQVPPPSSIQHGSIVGEFPEMTADQMLDEAIRRAQVAQAVNTMPITSGGPPVPEDSDFELLDVPTGGMSMVPQVPLMLSPAMSPTPALMPQPEVPSVPVTFSPGEVCKHERTTKAGSNAYQKVTKCKDCGEILELIKTEKAVKMVTKEPKECLHENKDYRGTTAATWRWKCKDCDHAEEGFKNPGETGRVGAAASSTSFPATSLAADLPDRLISLMSHTVDTHKAMGFATSAEQMDIIYAKCRMMVFGSGPIATSTRTAAYAPTAQTSPTSTASSMTSAPVPSSGAGVPRRVPTGPDPRTISLDQLDSWHDETLRHGAHQGRTFRVVADREKSYCKFLLGKFRQGALRDPSLIEFCRYLELCISHGGTAFMVHQAHVVKSEDTLVAIIDTGCNNTCHGEKWLQNYMQLTGIDLSLNQGSGSFKGVGGQVQVNGRREIPVMFRLQNGELAKGTIHSTELKGSEAPLLLSMGAQKKLGLVIDTEEGTVFSKFFKSDLEIVDRDGLPGICLIPNLSDEDGDTCLAMSSQFEDEVSSPSDKSTIEMDQIEFMDVPEDLELPHLDLSSCKVKVLSKGQKKNLVESLDEVEKEDLAMWSTLRQERDGGSHQRHQKLLPRGCKSFLLEIFAGMATLTMMASSWNLPVSAPVDIRLGGAEHNLLSPKRRMEVWRYVDEQDPFLLTFSPVCGPWSPWQGLNMSKSEETADKIEFERKRWYPVVKWMVALIKDRLRKGREVLLEQPWGSKMWTLKCLEDFLQEHHENELTGELAECVRLDQCCYDLKDRKSNLPHLKPTGLLLSSSYMKQHLQQRCDGSHLHEPLEGGNRTKLAQERPEKLCEKILQGAYEEMVYGIVKSAFPAENLAEEHLELGPLDAIHTEVDLAQPQQKRRKVDLHELSREEDFEEIQDERAENLLMEQEKERKAKWLAIPREKRVALRRLHVMTGHCSVPALIRMLRASAADRDVLQAAQHFQCQTCQETAKEQDPAVARPMKPSFQQVFNYELAADVFEIHDSEDRRHSILSMVDMSTHFHVAVRVGGGGVPGSKVCADAFNVAWFSWAGAPKYLVVDQGVHHKGKVAALMLAHGTQIRQVAARAPFQLGTAERHGGLLKQIMKRAIHDRQIHGADMIAALCSEAARVKNTLLNNGGYSPSQWVMGFQPEDPTSLLNGDFESNIGVHQNIVDVESGELGTQDRFMLQLLVRQYAKEAYMKADASQKIRKALLRKSVPLRGPIVLVILFPSTRKESGTAHAVF